MLIAKLKELKTKIRDKYQPKEVHRKFAQAIIKTWLEAFYLSPESIYLSIEELEEIDNQYFYINLLMVHCKEAAVRVSPQTWSGIEERMLRVPGD